MCPPAGAYRYRLLDKSGHSLDTLGTISGRPQTVTMHTQKRMSMKFYRESLPRVHGKAFGPVLCYSRGWLLCC